MPLFHLLLIAIIQGVTEFLPISSSGHLILLPNLTGLADQGQVLDVAVHVGTLGAVVLYFRKDALLALNGTSELLRGRMETPGAFLALNLLIATIPVIAIGFLVNAAGLDAAMRSTAIVGWAMLGFGLVLYWADRVGAETRKAQDWTLKHAAIMGMWQVLALIPGTSRSGITITGGRFLGYAREDAARLAMLMSIPTILGAGLVTTVDVIREGQSAALLECALAAVIAFFAALAALAVMMRFLKSVNFTPYVIYRVLFGLFLLAISYN